EPGPSQRRPFWRSRICSAPLRAALRPGHVVSYTHRAFFLKWCVTTFDPSPTRRRAMEPLSRRGVLAAAAAGTVATAAAAANAASFGNPDEPPQGQINTTGSPSSFNDP